MYKAIRDLRFSEQNYSHFHRIQTGGRSLEKNGQRDERIKRKSLVKAKKSVLNWWFIVHNTTTKRSRKIREKSNGIINKICKINYYVNKIYMF